MVATVTSVAKLLSLEDMWDVVVDIGPAEPDAVRESLRSLRIADEVMVTILWASTRHGAALTFGDFVSWYDDLWYPSADDVWVLVPEGSWLIELDHEEVLRFRTRRAE